MKKNEIREKVDYQIKQWLSLQERRETYVKFTPKAIDFICLMIENIESDKSAFWRFKESEDQSAQQFAISLIPNALNELRPFERYSRYESIKNVKDTQISSWEIWHSLSHILDRFCFIPKDI